LGSHYQQAAHLIDRAIRISKATRSVTCIIVPDDVAEAEHEDSPRAHGAVYSEIDSPNQLAGAWDDALDADRPVVYEAITDPEVPPLPPHIRFELGPGDSQG
jgi:thiamine pyrophosphate-dependent acetolactate synthase large subunit-like protein